MIPRLGTREYPFINLTPYLDIEELDRLIPSIYWGIAKSNPRPAVVTHTLDDFYSRERAEAFAFKHPIFGENYKNLLDGGASFKREAVIYASLAAGHYSGSQLIPITQLKPGWGFTSVHKRDAVETGPDYENFHDLLMWIYRLPFESLGRITLFLNPTGVDTPIHRDGDKPIPHKHELMWFNITGKNFFIADRGPNSLHSVTKRYVKEEDRAVFFDDMNWHGTTNDIGFGLSLRVDGVFKPSFRKLIGIDHLDNYLTDGIVL